MACHVKGKLARQIKERLGLESPRKPRKQRGPKKVPKPVLEARSWKFTVPEFVLPSVNDLLSMHWGRRSKFKLETADLLGHYGRFIPTAESKRTVLITVTRDGGRKEMDADNIRKICLDGLVKCGLLVDDSPAWCSCPDPVQVKGLECSTEIQLLETPDDC